MVVYPIQPPTQWLHPKAHQHVTSKPSRSKAKTSKHDFEISFQSIHLKTLLCQDSKDVFQGYIQDLSIELPLILELDALSQNCGCVRFRSHSVQRECLVRTCNPHHLDSDKLCIFLKCVSVCALKRSSCVYSNFKSQKGKKPKNMEFCTLLGTIQSTSSVWLRHAKQGLSMMVNQSRLVITMHTILLNHALLGKS